MVISGIPVFLWFNTHHHRFKFSIIINKRATKLTANTRSFHAAERHRRVEEGMHVDPDDPGVNGLRIARRLGGYIRTRRPAASPYGEDTGQPFFTAITNKAIPGRRSPRASGCSSLRTHRRRLQEIASPGSASPPQTMVSPLRVRSE